MNKKYFVKLIVSGNLQEITFENMPNRIKNVIGVLVTYKDEDLFYSIFDDCFFRLVPKESELVNNKDKYLNKIYVDINDCYYFKDKSFGIQLYERTGLEYMNKYELRDCRQLIGYYSDLSYLYLNMDTNVDYEDESLIDGNIIDSELEYEQKLDRPIAYTDGIRIPSARKRLIRL